MLKKNVNDFNPFFSELKTNWALLACGNREEHNAMTVSWGGIGVLWNKNVCFVFVRKSRYTLELMEKFDNFTLSFFEGDKKAELGQVFGKLSGRDLDKFKETNIDPIYDVDANCIYAKGAKKVLKLRKLFKSEFDADMFIAKGIVGACYPDNDYHVLYIGEILQYLEAEDEE